MVGHVEAAQVDELVEVAVFNCVLTPEIEIKHAPGVHRVLCNFCVCARMDVNLCEQVDNIGSRAIFYQFAQKTYIILIVSITDVFFKLLYRYI